MNKIKLFDKRFASNYDKNLPILDKTSGKVINKIKINKEYEKKICRKQSSPNGNIFLNHS